MSCTTRWFAVRNLKEFIKVSLSVIFLSGCAMMGSGSNMQTKGFYGRMAPARASAPLPVEIAKDIASISEEGILYITEEDIVAEVKDALLEKHGRISGQPLPKGQRAVDRRTASNRGGSRVQKKKPGFLSKNRRGPLLKSRRGSKRRGPLTIGKSHLPPLKGGKTVTYIVRLGDTLMKIAFDKYANYLRWKDIYHVNKNKMASPRKMRVRTELTIHNVKYVYIKKDGLPYLIRKKDTLKSISKKLYGTPDRWKEIWKNNPQLIQNPKKIYAGFTLRYKPPITKPNMLRVPANKEKKTSKK